MRRIAVFVMWLVLVGGSGIAALACSQPDFNATERAVINPARLDQAVFSAAVTRATNYARCKARRQAVTTLPALTSIAADLSKKMARQDNLFHEGNLKRKYRAAGIASKKFGENITLDYRLQHKDQRFVVRDAGKCAYVYQSSGQPIAQHSYASLALRVVDIWANSPKHRAILTDRAYRFVGTGLSYSAATATLCGRYFVTQNFAT